MHRKNPPRSHGTPHKPPQHRKTITRVDSEFFLEPNATKTRMGNHTEIETESGFKYKKLKKREVENWEDLVRRFPILSKSTTDKKDNIILGQGQNGVVFVAVKIKEKGEALEDTDFLAVKKVLQNPRAKDPRKDFENKRRVAYQEFQIISDHLEKIPDLNGLYMPILAAPKPLKQNGVGINVIMNIAALGNGSNALEIKYRLNKADQYTFVMHIAHQLLTIESLLIDNHIFHRDGKLENILIERNGDIRLSDFGSAIAHFKENESFPVSNTADARYFPPECVLNKSSPIPMESWRTGLMLLQLMANEETNNAIEAFRRDNTERMNRYKGQISKKLGNMRPGTKRDNAIKHIRDEYVRFLESRLVPIYEAISRSNPRYASLLEITRGLLLSDDSLRLKPAKALTIFADTCPYNKEDVSAVFEKLADVYIHPEKYKSAENENDNSDNSYKAMENDSSIYSDVEGEKEEQANELTESGAASPDADDTNDKNYEPVPTDDRTTAVDTYAMLSERGNKSYTEMPHPSRSGSVSLDETPDLTPTPKATQNTGYAELPTELSTSHTPSKREDKAPAATHNEDDYDATPPTNYSFIGPDSKEPTRTTPPPLDPHHYTTFRSTDSAATESKPTPDESVHEYATLKGVLAASTATPTETNSTEIHKTRTPQPSAYSYATLPTTDTTASDETFNHTDSVETPTATESKPTSDESGHPYATLSDAIAASASTATHTKTENADINKTSTPQPAAYTYATLTSDTPPAKELKEGELAYSDALSSLTSCVGQFIDVLHDLNSALLDYLRLHKVDVENLVSKQGFFASKYEAEKAGPRAKQQNEDKGKGKEHEKVKEYTPEVTHKPGNKGT